MIKIPEKLVGKTLVVSGGRYLSTDGRAMLAEFIPYDELPESFKDAKEICAYTAHALNEHSQLAAEIKRLEASLKIATEEIDRWKTDDQKLRARIAELEQVSKNDSWSIVEKTDLIEKQAERIALLEATLGLPDGCDVFQLERAMKEGAVDDYGKPWSFFGKSSGESVYFKSENGDLVGFYHNGKASLCAVRLWCKKGVNES